MIILFGRTIKAGKTQRKKKLIIFKTLNPLQEAKGNVAAKKKKKEMHKVRTSRKTSLNRIRKERSVTDSNESKTKNDGVISKHQKKKSNIPTNTLIELKRERFFTLV